MRWFCLLLSGLLLAGCFTQGKRGGDMSMAIFDFGVPATRLLDKPRPLVVAVEVRAPLWFDSLGIDYRLAYVDPARLREYARARWAAPPAQLIQQRLIEQLALAPAGQSRADCVLRLDVAEFSQTFVRPESSFGVLQVRAQWLDRSRRSLAVLYLKIEKPAPTSDSRGGVSALTASVEQLALDLLAWEKSLAANGKAGGCAG